MLPVQKSPSRGSNLGTNKGLSMNLVAHRNDVEVKLNGVSCMALLDTGSTVSTLSEQFYKDHLLNIEIKAIDFYVKHRGCRRATATLSGLN